MKKPIAFLICLVLLTAMTVPVFANSAEPPVITILTTNLPEDAVLSFETAAGEVLEFRQVRLTTKAWERQFRLWYPWEYKHTDGAKLRITAEGDSVILALPNAKNFGYNTLMTLDYEAKTLTLGLNPWRQPLLTALRISLTLLIEGVFFYLFGFRQRKSWRIFLVLNLLTQAWLNSVINNNAFSNAYWVPMLYLMELAIFAAEMLVISICVKEQRRWKRVVGPLAANSASFAVGMLLISWLPI